MIPLDPRALSGEPFAKLRSRVGVTPGVTIPSRITIPAINGPKVAIPVSRIPLRGPLDHQPLREELPHDLLGDRRILLERPPHSAQRARSSAVTATSSTAAAVRSSVEERGHVAIASA
jgi:hypothetical protein